MKRFQSYKDYWIFQNEVKNTSRYVWSDKVKEFFCAFEATCKKREDKIPKKSVLWRAQLGNSWRREGINDEKGNVVDYIEEESPFSPDRMKPKKNHCLDGRANPKGLPCLYLTTYKDTALAEVRPWIGAYISLAQFRILKEIIIINFTMDEVKESIIYFNEPSLDETEKKVWSDINKTFSKPTNRDNTSLDYVPTQIISEFVKKLGYGGVAYASSLGAGHNIALFDPNIAKQLNGQLHYTKSICFEFDHPAKNDYFLKE